MTLERAILVRVAGSAGAVLSADIAATAARCRKALPGDRTDTTRYELLSAQLEKLAWAAAVAGADTVAIPAGDAILSQAMIQTPADLPASVCGIVGTWLAAGDFIVEVRLPFYEGATELRTCGREVQPPAERWQAPPGVEGKQAVAQRFREQVERVANGDPAAMVSPSGVSNSVLTNTLREFVARSGPVVEAPVVYRDGSQARPFPLQSLRLQDDLPDPDWPVLRFALLSIRHAEMDIDIDGAWLRNADISRPRPLGETDDLAYEVSQRQLSHLTRDRPILIYMYQTGLQPAVVGFYRAVTHHLQAEPGSLAVVPMYYRTRRTAVSNPAPALYTEGTAWAT